MTFEEWLLEQGFKHPVFGLMVKHSEYALMKAAWNAAIEASRSAAASAPSDQGGQSSWEQVDQELQKLLTS